MEDPRARPSTSTSSTSSTAEGPIPEGEGRFPWWIWPVFVGWLVYAFAIAPFEVTRP